MEERSPKNAVLQTVKTVLIVLAVFAAAILYIFVSSAVQGKNYKGKTSDMYGRDSLEYVGEPVMKISVWQRNEKNIETNTQYLGYSNYFYDLVPLILKPGETVSTEKNKFDAPYTPYILITVEYDGEIVGEYDLKIPGALAYSGSKDAVPGVQGGSTVGKTVSVPRFTQKDNSFFADKVITLEISEYIRDVIGMKDNKRGISTLYQMEESVDDYTTKEKLSDLYPDAPEELKDVYRYVFTTHVTIHAKHPNKSDVTVATAVLAVRQISEWQGTTGETRMMLNEAKCYEENHTEIVVESYTQSDMFAFE